MPTSQERSEKNLHEQEDKREGNYRFSDTACGVSPLALFNSLGLYNIIIKYAIIFCKILVWLSKKLMIFYLFL